MERTDMPATRHRFTKCGHKGFGGYCHRCKQAEDLQAKLLTLKSSAPEHAKIKAEAERLAAP